MSEESNKDECRQVLKRRRALLLCGQGRRIGEVSVCHTSSRINTWFGLSQGSEWAGASAAGRAGSRADARGEEVQHEVRHELKHRETWCSGTGRAGGLPGCRAGPGQSIMSGSESELPRRTAAQRASPWLASQKPSGGGSSRAFPSRAESAATPSCWR